MPHSPPATLRLTLDLGALADNWRALDRLSGAAAAGAAVKANCYGLGVDACVPVLHAAGARDFFVAHWTEVPAVAGHAPPQSISVLHGPLSGEDTAFARGMGVRPVINSLYQARLWLDGGGGLCDLMVDTGMNRLGIRPEEAVDPLIAALDIDLLMSHLSSADEDCVVNREQVTAFRSILPIVRHKRASIANSAALMIGEEYHFNLTRPGIALYGGMPRREMRDHIRQVAGIEAAVIQRRLVRRGERIGYNGTFEAPADMPVGIVSLGYADGFMRAWGEHGGGHLLSQGRKLPLVGRVSMDMVAIDLSPAPDTREGDFVTVPFDLPQASAVTGLSQYELLTTMGRRFAR